jgi:hypothetical protein
VAQPSFRGICFLLQRLQLQSSFLSTGKIGTSFGLSFNPGTRAFESRNPGALFVALSRAKSAGNDFADPDFAWHSSVLVNEDRLCHVVKSATV